MTPRRPPSRAVRNGAPGPSRRVPGAGGASAAADTAPDAESRAALEEERRFLLDSLRDLESERAAGDIADDDYASLRDDYTARAAEVLRRIEAAEAPASASRRARGRGGERPGPAAGGGERPERTAGPPLRSRSRGRRRAALAMAVIVGVAALAGVSVVAFSVDRGPGQPSSGRDLSTPAGRLAEAHALESQGKAADALKLYDAVLREEPANVEALTYKGWLLARAGLTDPAMEALDRAIAVDPRYPDAHFFRGMVLYQGRNDPAGAVAEFEAFLANNPPPDSVAAVREVLERARGDAGLAPAPSPEPSAPPPTG